jgi:hypothetical protein
MGNQSSLRQCARGYIKLASEVIRRERTAGRLIDTSETIATLSQGGPTSI